jgi:hypothetical protein
MKNQFIAFAMAFVSVTAFAQNVAIERNTLGSGEQGVKGFENSTLVLDNDIYHAPQYMAAFPTAATIWPRVVDVPCIKTGDSLKCEGYEWTPKMGRGEYLFFRPHITEAPVPQVEVRERIIIKEVPAKKIRQ